MGQLGLGKMVGGVINVRFSDTRDKKGTFYSTTLPLSLLKLCHLIAPRWSCWVRVRLIVSPPVSFIIDPIK